MSKSMSVEFADEFDPTQARRKARRGRPKFLSEKVLDALRERPGVWARVKGDYAKGRTAVASSITRLRKNPDYNGFEFSIERRHTRSYLMARFVGLTPPATEEAPVMVTSQGNGASSEGQPSFGL